MAEGKRIYEIKINGLQESYEGVKSLREALNTLTDTVVNVKEEEAKTASTRKEAAAGTDALAKATQKLNDWDRSYQTELALVNKELSNNKKEINDAIKLQEAQATVDAKQLDTYAQKQQYLSALNKLIRNHSTATEEDRAAIDRMVQESAALQAELKATDEQMKIYVRNVGNYPGAAKMVVDSHKSIKLQLRELKEEMTSMLANGVSKTDEAYLKLAKRAGQLKDAMVDANKDITNFASDTRGLTNAINLATTAVSTYQLYNSALQVFGGQNEAAAESMRKMMGIMTMLNSLQQIQNNLLANGSASGRLYTKAVELIQAALGLKKTATEADIATTEASTAANEANAVSQEANAAANEASAVAEGIETAATEANTVATGTNTGALGTNTGALGANATASQGAAAATNSMSVAQKAGAVASKTLSVALRAIPLVAIIGLVMALIQNWESIWNWFKKTFPVLDTLSKKFNKFGGLMNAIVSGAKAVAAAVMNWLVNPFKTFANVVGKILEGDFKGAWQAALDGLKNQFKGSVDAFKGEIVKGYARGQEEMTAKAAEESNKRTKQELAELKIQERNNKTYSKKYIELQKKDFEERKKMAKGNQEELNKIKLEEMQFEADIEDKKTAYAKSQANERKKIADKAAKDAQKAAEDYQKKIDKLLEDTQKTIEEGDKLNADKKKQILKNEEDAAKAAQQTAAKAASETLKNLTDQSFELDKITKKINVAKENLQKAQAEFNETGSESAEKTMKEQENVLKELQQDYVLQNERYLDLKLKHDKLLSDIATANGKLKQNYMQTLADNAIALKKTYTDLLDKIVNKELPEALYELGKATDDATKESLEKQIDGLNEEYERLQKSMKELFGDYSDEAIVIPVDIKVEDIVKRVDELRRKLPDGSTLLFNESQVVDMIFGFGDKIDELFKNIAGSTSFKEILKQFDYWIDKADLTEIQLMDIQKILNSDLPINRIQNNLLNYADALGVTQDEMRGVFEYSDKVGLKSDKLVKTFEQIGYAAGLSEEKIEELRNVFSSGLGLEETKKKVQELLANGTTTLAKFGEYAYDTKKQISDVNKTLDEQLKKTLTDYIASYDKQIKDAELSIKHFQELTKDIKFEPVMDDKVLSKWFSGQILNIDKTRERYDNLKSKYEEYQKSIEDGSEERKKIEDAWQAKLIATKGLYGEDSYEYSQAIKEKERLDASYVIEYERVTQQIAEIDKKTSKLREDYWKSVHDKINEIWSGFNENVFQPLAEGFGDLLAFQLEEAQEALDEITELYDKAVEARKESADRMKQINDELRADEGQNKEALQQRLAEEEVLLVQREEAERALEKEKEKRKREVEKKEAQQRVLELSQKLVEGIANTALGVTAALKYGPILGPVFAAIIGAMGAVQTGIILKQIDKAKSKMAKGGKVGEDGVSRSHKQGGHRIEDTNIEVEGGEWVINKKSSQKYDSLLRSINDDKVGLVQKQVEIIREKRIINNNQPIRFADGGQINTLAATRAVTANNDLAAITDLIKQIDFEPTVSVVDINRKNKNLVRVQQYAGKAG